MAKNHATSDCAGEANLAIWCSTANQRPFFALLFPGCLDFASFMFIGISMPPTGLAYVVTQL